MQQGSADSALSAAVRSKRSIGLLVASVLYVVVGIFGVVFGVAMLTIGQSFGQLDLVSPGIGAQAGGYFTIVAIVALVVGVLWVAGGIGLWLAKPWSRLLGLGLAVIGAVVFGLAALGALTNLSGGSLLNLAMNAVLAGLFGYSFWSIWTSRSYFARR